MPMPEQCRNKQGRHYYIGYLKKVLRLTTISIARKIQKIIGSYGCVCFLTIFFIFAAFRYKELRLRLGRENIFCFLVQTSRNTLLYVSSSLLWHHAQFYKFIAIILKSLRETAISKSPREIAI